MIPPDQTVRDAVANLAMTFREWERACIESPPVYVNSSDFQVWADRLERAVQRMDAQWHFDKVGPTLADGSPIPGRPLEDEKASQRP